MKIYIVRENEFGDPVAVFSTLEAADAFVEKNPAQGEEPEPLYVDGGIFVLDEEPEI